MAAYTIGSAKDYADYAVAEAALTLPEAGGTIFTQHGTITGSHTFTSANYSNGLTIRAAAAEEADGALGGTLFDGVMTSTVEGMILENLNIESLNVINITSTQMTADNCDIGAGTAQDSISFGGTTLAAFVNCILRDGFDDNAASNALAAGVNFTRCSFVDSTRYGGLRADCDDCFSYGNATGDYHSTCTGNYNASGDTSASIFTNNLQSQASSNFTSYAGNDFNISAGSSLRTAGTAGGIIGADLAAGGATITTPPAEIRRGESFTVIGTGFGAAQLSGGAVAGGITATITAWADTSISGYLPVASNLLYTNTSVSLVVTADDSSSDTAALIPWLPATGRSFLALVSPVYSDDGYMLFGYTGTPAPVSTDQMEYNTLTSENSIANTPTADSDWILAGMPTVTQTSTIQIIRAATGVRSSDWTITWEVGSGGAGSTSLGLSLSLGL